MLPTYDVIRFVHTSVWKALFGKQADVLEKDDDHDNQYMITDHDMLVNRFVSVPRDMGGFNCASFVVSVNSTQFNCREVQTKNQRKCRETHTR